MADIRLLIVYSIRCITDCGEIFIQAHAGIAYELGNGIGNHFHVVTILPDTLLI